MTSATANTVFLEHFDHLLATPDAVERLNEAILDLAVRGKLVPQDPTDEPARELLTRIRAKNETRALKKHQPIDKKPYQLPEGWSWCPITDLFQVISTRGYQLKTTEYSPVGKYPIVSQGKEIISGYSEQDELVLHLANPVVIFGDHTREVKYVDFDFIVGADGVKVLSPVRPLCEKYFYLFLKGMDLESRGYARHFKSLANSLFPLPF